MYVDKINDENRKAKQKSLPPSQRQYSYQDSPLPPIPEKENVCNMKNNRVNETTPKLSNLNKKGPAPPRPPPPQPSSIITTTAPPPPKIDDFKMPTQPRKNITAENIICDIYKYIDNKFNQCREIDDCHICDDDTK